MMIVTIIMTIIILILIITTYIIINIIIITCIIITTTTIITIMKRGLRGSAVTGLGLMQSSVNSAYASLQSHQLVDGVRTVLLVLFILRLGGGGGDKAFNKSKKT
jgi:hypothetical protein